MNCMYRVWSFNKKLDRSNEYNYKWSFYWVITWKFYLAVGGAFSWGIKIFVGESTGGFWLVGVLFPNPSPPIAQ